MYYSHRERQDCQQLMREREWKRRLIEQRYDAKRCLQGYGARQHTGPLEIASIPPSIECVQTGEYPDRVGNHAVVELHREGVFEKISPGGLNKPQALGGWNK